MEDRLFEIYSIIPGISEDLIQELFDLEASLLTIITLVYFLLALGLSVFFYFNPFDFKRSFWKINHWLSVLAISSIISFLFTLGTCYQNEDNLANSTFPEFLGFALVTAILNAILYFIFSFAIRKLGNAVTQFTPF